MHLGLGNAGGPSQVGGGGNADREKPIGHRITRGKRARGESATEYYE